MADAQGIADDDVASGLGVGTVDVEVMAGGEGEIEAMGCM